MKASCRSGLTARALHRKLSLQDLDYHGAGLEVLLDKTRNIIDGPEAGKKITTDAHYEHHHLDLKQETNEFESNSENAQTATVVPEGKQEMSREGVEYPDTRRVPGIPLNLVIAGCPSLRSFYQGVIRHWHQLFDAACHIQSAMGISPSTWEEAQKCMGPEQASILVVAMLERFADLGSPGGYLCTLTAKAVVGKVSSGPMVMALIGRRSAA